MADLAKIVEDLSSLTVLEAAELAKLLEEKWASRLLPPSPSPLARPPVLAPLPSKSRPSSRSCSLRPATRRSRSSRRSARSPASASRKPRTSSRRAQARQGRRDQGRGREAQGPAREGRRQGRAQVIRRWAETGPSHPARSPRGRAGQTPAGSGSRANAASGGRRS